MLKVKSKNLINLVTEELEVLKKLTREYDDLLGEDLITLKTYNEVIKTICVQYDFLNKVLSTAFEEE